MCQGLLRLVILNICVVLIKVKIISLEEKNKGLSRGGLESVMECRRLGMYCIHSCGRVLDITI